MIQSVKGETLGDVKIVANELGQFLIIQVANKEGSKIIGTKLNTASNGKSWIGWNWYYNCCTGICGKSKPQCEATMPSMINGQLSCGCNGHCTPNTCAIKYYNTQVSNKDIKFLIYCNTNSDCTSPQTCVGNSCQ